MKNKYLIAGFIFPLTLLCCKPESGSSRLKDLPVGISFRENIDFLREFTDVILLQEPSGKGLVAVSGALQGRVMTSSSNGMEGLSHGWINYDLFKSGDTLAHINPFGGEERFWLGPEGGQYSIFFKPGAAFDLDEWQTPRMIDLDAYQLITQTEQKAIFQKSASLTNYSEFNFMIHIERVIEVMSDFEIFRSLRVKANPDLQVVGYKTTNTLTNIGDTDWKKETGLLSIWLLGMFNHSDSTTVVVPFLRGDESTMGPIVNDDYFGKVPADRLKLGVGGVLYFRADGKYRSKIGLSPKRATDVLGSYAADKGVLTIVKYSKPQNVDEYVNSAWALQEEPYRGDVINSYNDGPPEPGKQPLGPFYELETSSPALALRAGESGTHVQQTYHFEGEVSALDEMARQLLGVSLEEIKSAFN